MSEIGYFHHNQNYVKKIAFLLILEVAFIDYIYNCVVLDTEKGIGTLMLGKINDLIKGNAC